LAATWNCYSDVFAVKIVVPLFIYILGKLKGWVANWLVIVEVVLKFGGVTIVDGY